MKKIRQSESMVKQVYEYFRRWILKIHTKKLKNTYKKNSKKED